MIYKLTKKVLRNDLVIPEGYRLIEDYELLKLLRKDKKIFKLVEAGWLWCNTLDGVRAAGLDYDDGEFRVIGDDYVYDVGRSRGVIIKKRREVKNK